MVLAFQSSRAETELSAGTRLSVRLRSSISSKHSQPGDPVSAALIAPVRVNGRELIPSGFIVEGAVEDPGPAQKRLNHSVLRLGFGRLIGKANQSVAFQGKVQSVDNGRESVDSEGIIHGLRPLRRRPGEIEDLLMLAAAAHPAILASLEVGRFIVAEKEKPRVMYEPGVELWLVLTSPFRIKTMPRPETVGNPTPANVVERTTRAGERPSLENVHAARNAFRLDQLCLFRLAAGHCECLPACRLAAGRNPRSENRSDDLPCRCRSPFLPRRSCVFAPY